MAPRNRRGHTRVPDGDRKQDESTKNLLQTGDPSDPNNSPVTEPWWRQQPMTAFKALLSARICAAIWSNITDCDETFNYWEPTHFLIHGRGLQTWEYSPTYAIRSYAYLWLYGLPAYFYTQILQSNKAFVFYFVRCLLAFVCAICETYFYKGVLRQFGSTISQLTLFFLTMSSGMFIASTAFLPSSFSMYMTLLVYGAWLQEHHRLCIAAAVANVLIGWPFAGILCLPVAVRLLFMRKRRTHFVKWGIISLSFIGVPLVLVDTHYYGKFVLAPLNIVAYNVFSKHGANLYGVETWFFYYLNCFLNLNVVFLAALAAPALATLCSVVKSLKAPVSKAHWTCISGMVLWMSVFFSQAHKEERFMFPVYPLMCLSAAFALDLSQQVVTRRRFLNDAFRILSTAFIVIFTALSLSRSFALYRGFNAPMDLYMGLEGLEQDYQFGSRDKVVNLCVGKEWHRFPNSFFLPSKAWRLQFVESEFRGQLPKPYAEVPMASRLTPTDMNDANKEELSRYISVLDCHFLVDSDYPEASQRDPPYSRDSANWTIVESYPFLDAQRSPQLFRAFYIPYLSDKKCKFIGYNLLQNKKKHFPVPKVK